MATQTATRTPDQVEVYNPLGSKTPTEFFTGKLAEMADFHPMAEQKPWTFFVLQDNKGAQCFAAFARSSTPGEFQCAISNVYYENPLADCLMTQGSNLKVAAPAIGAHTDIQEFLAGVVAQGLESASLEDHIRALSIKQGFEFSFLAQAIAFSGV